MSLMGVIAEEGRRSVSPFGHASRVFGGGASGWIEIAAALNGSLANEMTVCSWARPTSAGVYKSIFANEYPSTVRLAHGSSLNAQWSSGRFSGGKWVSTDEEPATLNVWTHVATIVTGTAVELWINGTMSRSVEDSRVITSDRPWRIGRRWDFPDYFAGSIADLRVFAGAYPNEVSRASAGLPPSVPPVGWWLRDSDDTLDWSGNSFHGTNYGSAFSTEGPL